MTRTIRTIGKTNDLGQVTITNGIIPICQTYGDPGNPRRHDEHARLIAAAPELLEALETLTTLAEELGLWPINVYEARAAIARARGG